MLSGGLLVQPRDALAPVQLGIALGELAVGDDEHDPEGTTIAYERAQVTALLSHARDDLVALDAALDRIEIGTAQACEACGGPIPLERLFALPSVVTCVECARRCAFRRR